MLEPNIFYRKLTRNRVDDLPLSNFYSNALTCDPALFPGRNSPNIAKSNRIFPGKRGGDKALILTYLDSPMADVFPHY